MYGMILKTEKGSDFMTDKLSVADRLRTARKRAGLTQQQLAKHYGISLRTVEAWERSLRTPPEYVLNLLLRCMELDFSPKAEVVEQEKILSAPKETIFLDQHGRPLKEPVLSAIKQAYDDRKVQYIPVTDYEGNDTGEESLKGKLYMVLAPEEFGLDMGFEFRVKEV